MTYHTLYSFRRCPYAIRVRWAFLLTGHKVICREVNLKAKPRELLLISPKGTVPVLITNTGIIIDESISIINWALEDKNLSRKYNVESKEVKQLILQNDDQFKYHLDRYKYPGRFPGENPDYHKSQAISILIDWNERLASSSSESKWLVSGEESLADWSLWPFVRQFRNIDPSSFDSNKNLTQLKTWLDNFVQSKYYVELMYKNKFWKYGDQVKYFPNS